MRLLFLSPFPPRPLYGGAVVRNHYLARHLCERHQVWGSFVGLDGGEQFAGEVPLRSEGRRALFDPQFLWRAYRALRDNNLQMIVSTSLIAGLHGALLKLLTGLPFWMDEHNVEWHCSKRYGHRFWWLIYLLEGFILKQADHVTCVSDADRERLISGFRLDPERVVVAPNGVDYPRLANSESGEPGERPKRILFFGVLDYPPNAEAVRVLATEIAPRVEDDIQLLVAGRGGESLRDSYPDLQFHGFVDDIHALIRDCDGLVVPILAGGGTRMKILETLACDRPVVSTSCGAEGIDRVAAGEALTVTDSYEEMARWINELPRGKRSKTGPGFVELYDWEKIWQNKAPL
ncbi:MAG: glycosyltransferase family 4 protein [Candidatus Eremiobacteraeota bacterium]|nr:glycosyltransferase family 4 protein [Candidatus Eremiobacteraeota bacterium]